MKKLSGNNHVRQIVFFKNQTNDLQYGKRATLLPMSAPSCRPAIAACPTRINDLFDFTSMRLPT